MPVAAGVVRADPAGGADDAGDPFNARLSLHVTQAEEAQRFAVPFLQERAKKWRLADVSHEADGTSIMEFDLRLKKSIDLAAFVRELEQGDPHVKRVELMRSKSKKPEA